MRRKKLFISLLLVVILSSDGLLLGWYVSWGDTKEIATCTLHIGFTLYALGVVWHSVNHNTPSFHYRSVLHLAILTFLASVLLSLIAILPGAVAPVARIVPNPWHIWHARLGLYIILCITTVTTRLGPRLRYPPESIYAEKTIFAGTNTTEENVSGVVGMLAHAFMFK